MYLRRRATLKIEHRLSKAILEYFPKNISDHLDDILFSKMENLPQVKSNPQSKGVDSIFEDFKFVDLISQTKCFCDIGHFKRSYR